MGTAANNVYIVMRCSVDFIGSGQYIHGLTTAMWPDKKVNFKKWRTIFSHKFLKYIYAAQNTVKNLTIKNMLIEINPKLPMRDKAVTKDYYINKLGFQLFGDS